MRRKRKEREWVDPWTLKEMLDDYLEFGYPFDDSRDRDEYVSMMEYKIKMAYSELERRRKNDALGSKDNPRTPGRG